ncbi:MAG: hypothetical protein ABGX27_00925 [Desulfurobacteriaceae bacterium]
MKVIPKREFVCLECETHFEEPFGKPKWMLKCPKCGSDNIVRSDGSCRGGWGREYGRGYGRGGNGWGRCGGRRGGRGNGWRWRFWQREER